MSVLGNKWVILNESDKTILQKLLENRGIASEQELISIDQQELHDPFLFSEMQRALDRIDKAIKQEQRIIVFGDYDVDGISSAAIVYKILAKIGAQVSCRIPHRVNDGYGLSEKFISDFQENKVKLLITVDCGISCAEVISKCKKEGIDTIITDHHAIPENFPSEAVAVIHPKHDNNYPYEHLTGSGIALKLAHALILKYLPEDKHNQALEELIDLASLGTVADLGPLTGENRLIVKRGLRRLAQTRWLGLDMIMKQAKISKENLNASSIGFAIAPRINAAGRIDDPYIPLKLLLQENSSEKAEQLSQKLEQLNQKRRKMTLEACQEVKGIFSEENLPKILIAKNENWHAGILGLIAGRICEEKSRPAIIFQDFGDHLVGSARSIESFDITKALCHCKDLIATFGGHSQAAGLTIKKENYQAFVKSISDFAEKNINVDELTNNLEIDCEITSQDINQELIEKMGIMQPFGMANAQPKFILKNISPLFMKQVGSDGSHLKFAVKVNESNLPVIAFRMGEFIEQIRKSQNIDLVFQIQERHWNGKKQIELQALDFKIC